MIQVIEEKKYWDDFISYFEESDLYHTFDYHMIAKGDHRPILLKYTEGKACIGLPLLIRKIPDTSYYDATSVYGYVGPLCKNILIDFDEKHFENELIEYFTLNNIISVFSRLNPFLPLQQKVLNKIGFIEKKGRVVSINLKKNIDLQRQEFSKRLKGQLNKIRKHCHVKNVTNDVELQEFIDIYHENMDRVNAEAMYYFNKKYFKSILKSNSYNTETLLVVHNESKEVIGGSMFFFKNSIIHYHLSGSKREFLHLMPSKLLIDEMRIRATHMGLNYFNLGGGLGGNDDSLLQFKTSFSKNIKDFYVWKLIVKPLTYNDMVRKCNINNKAVIDFFPAYRNQVNKLHAKSFENFIK
ncbi:peptidoglycan bridge formation glycyltransferase FemA/FemB family protein [Croceitalea rosinachiae]|uniref:Peptidoglycan bridge formation glycyltransferase FemA/FemB family protein n=1 Tax=Croceitalea rosinachiae TaxID=3075596 RepID=A0ABU3ACE2_9FLAO|nr:peptidoglycan bridge formation glycyltransferase FemA/FemB family protein [Croceitalea sp. F388]MDT0607851.1 peptidoglycan bridge formation glycyltransferase FemA/FemB family protein [Croceitalea sp. F388]